MALRRLDRDRLASDMTDIRHWRLFDRTGEKVGVVAGLLYDPDAGQVRYVIADLWTRHVLLPVGQIVIDEVERRVIARDYARDDMLKLAAYRDEEMTAEGERRHFRDFFPAIAAHEGPDYARGAFRTGVPSLIQRIEEKLRPASRREKVSGVAFLTSPVDRPVQSEVELMREDLEITHHPVNRPATGNERPTVEDDVIRIPIVEEEVVVQKRLVVKEIIEIRKRQTRERVKVDETVRGQTLSLGETPPTRDRSR